MYGRVRKHERKGKGLNLGRKEGGKVIDMDERKGGTEGRWIREGKEMEKKM